MLGCTVPDSSFIHSARVGFWSFLNELTLHLSRLANAPLPPDVAQCNRDPLPGARSGSLGGGARRGIRCCSVVGVSIFPGAQDTAGESSAQRFALLPPNSGGLADGAFDEGKTGPAEVSLKQGFWRSGKVVNYAVSLADDSAMACLFVRGGRSWRGF